MNKRGHTPTILFFVLSAVLVGIAIGSFISFDSRVADDSRRISVLISDINFKEAYAQATLELMVNEAILNGGLEDFESAFLTEANARDPKDASLVGNLFGKIRNEDYELDVIQGVLEIDDVFVKSEFEGNEMKRTFDLSVRFDSNGVLP